MPTALPHPGPSKRAFLGWWVLAICGLAVFTGAYGLTYTVSAFVDPLLADLGISRSLLSTGYAVGTGTAGLVILFLGRRLDRWGSRKVMAFGIVGLAIGLVLLSVTTGPAVLFLGFMLIRTFGQGTIPLAARVLVPNWFFRNRARAFSLLGLSSTAAIALLPPLNEWLIDQFGWRTTWRIASVAMVLVMVPVILLLVRDTPEEVGQYPDGDTMDADGVAPVSDAGIGLTLPEAKRTAAFWALVAAGAVPPLIMTGLHLHQSAMFVERGTPHAIATATFTIEAFSMLLANLSIGWLNDRISPRIALVIGLSLMVAALMALFFSGNGYVAVLYAMLRGAASGSMGVAADVAWPTYFGRRHLGSIRGFGMAASLFGSAIGPLPFGLAADYLGGYSAAIVALMFVPAAVAVVVFVTRPPTLHRSVEALVPA